MRVSMLDPHKATEICTEYGIKFKTTSHSVFNVKNVLLIYFLRI